jgi:hypothetical protein
MKPTELTVSHTPDEMNRAFAGEGLFELSAQFSTGTVRSKILPPVALSVRDKILGAKAEQAN